MEEQESLSKQRLLAPSPWGFPISGHFWRARSNVLRLLEQSVLKHGDLIRFRLGPMQIHLVNEPSLVREVLISKRANFDKQTRSTSMLALICGKSLLTSEGQSWQWRRRVMQPFFHRKIVVTMMQQMIASTGDMILRWKRLAKDQIPIDIQSEMMKLTYEIVGRCLFGQDLKEASSRVERAMTLLMRQAYQRWRGVLTLPIRWRTPSNVRFQNALKSLEDVVNEIIQHRKHLGSQTTDFLSMLLEGKDPETGACFQDEEVKSEVLTFLLAGHETTANALSWAFYLLTQHPHVADDIADESAIFLQDNPANLGRGETSSLTHRVFQEAIRLYPSIWAMERRAISDDVLGGYDIPRGSSVIISPYLLHRHPSYWDDPLRFFPQRFDGRNHEAYFPFGSGARYCVGKEFAMTEAHVILSIINRHFRLTPLNLNDVTPEPAITLRMKKGLQIKLSERRVETFGI